MVALAVALFIVAVCVGVVIYAGKTGKNGDKPSTRRGGGGGGPSDPGR